MWSSVRRRGGNVNGAAWGELASSEWSGQGEAVVLSIHTELRALTARLQAEEIPYALCGALAVAVHGYPRATLDIDLLALNGSEERILQCGRALGFTLEAAPTQFVKGTVRIKRLSNAVAGEEDVLMLDVLSVSLEIEKAIATETLDWEGVAWRTVTRESLIRLKRLRGSAQDLADMEKLARKTKSHRRQARRFPGAYRSSRNCETFA